SFRITMVKCSTGKKMHVQHIEEVGFDGVDKDARAVLVSRWTASYSDGCEQIRAIERNTAPHGHVLNAWKGPDLIPQAPVVTQLLLRLFVVFASEGNAKFQSSWSVESAGRVLFANKAGKKKAGAEEKHERQTNL